MNNNGEPKKLEQNTRERKLKDEQRTSLVLFGLYLYTWDSGGDEDGLRPLAPKPDGFTFGGGEEGDPKYMDKVKVVLRNKD